MADKTDATATESIEDTFKRLVGVWGEVPDDLRELFGLNPDGTAAEGGLTEDAHEFIVQAGPLVTHAERLKGVPGVPQGWPDVVDDDEEGECGAEFTRRVMAEAQRDGALRVAARAQGGDGFDAEAQARYGVNADGTIGEGGLTAEGKAFGQEALRAISLVVRAGKLGHGGVRNVAGRDAGLLAALDLAGPIRAALRAGARAFADALGDEDDDDDESGSEAFSARFMAGALVTIDKKTGRATGINFARPRNASPAAAAEAAAAELRLMRAFGLAPDDAPSPAAGGNDNPATEGTATPSWSAGNSGAGWSPSGVGETRSSEPAPDVCRPRDDGGAASSPSSGSDGSCSSSGE